MRKFVTVTFIPCACVCPPQGLCWGRHLQLLAKAIAVEGEGVERGHSNKRCEYSLVEATEPLGVGGGGGCVGQSSNVVSHD